MPFPLFTHRTIAISAQIPVETVPKTPLSQKAFAGLVRLLQFPIAIESNARQPHTGTDTIALSLGQTSIVQFLGQLLANIPTEYAPSLYLHGRFGDTKMLAKCEKGKIPLFNDIDILVFIHTSDYDTAKPSITQAMQNSMANITHLSPDVAGARGFQKKTLLTPNKNPYLPPYGALFNFGPRNSQNAVEINILALGPDPIENRAPIVETLCSSSLDSFMIGPLNALIEEIQNKHLSHKNIASIQHTLGILAPKSLSKHFYTEADLHLIEAFNVVMSNPNAPAISFDRFAKQAMQANNIRIASPMIIETMAQTLHSLPLTTFERALKQYLQIHFPEAPKEDIQTYLQTLTHLLSAMESTHSAQLQGPKIQALCAIVAQQKHFPKHLGQNPFRFEPPHIIASWCSTLAIIDREAPSGKIRQDALLGMEAYLNLLENTPTETERQAHYTFQNDLLEYRILTHLRDHPLLFERVLPALSKVSNSMFSPDAIPPSLTAETLAIWQDWVEHTDNPIIIPFYKHVMQRHPNPTPATWEDVRTRCQRMGNTADAARWFSAGLQVLFGGTHSDWTTVVTAYSAGASPEEALIQHATLSTLERARQIATLCPKHEDLWQQRLITDTQTALDIRTFEVQIALETLANTPEKPFTWQMLQMTLQLLALVPTIPESVCHNLAQRIGRKTSGPKPQHLYCNPSHLTTLPGHEVLCAKLFIKISETKTRCEDFLAPLATTVLQSVASKKITLGLVKAALKQYMEQTQLWPPSMAALSVEDYCKYLHIAINCGVQTDTLRAVLIHFPDLSQIAKLPQKEGLDVLLQGLKILKKETPSDTNQRAVFLSLVDTWSPVFLHCRSVAYDVFALLDLPEDNPRCYASFQRICLIAKQMGLLSTPISDHTHSEIMAPLGKWYAKVRPEAGENDTVLIQTLDVRSNSISTKSVNNAMNELFYLMVNENQYTFVMSVLRHTLTQPHPLQVSEILLRTHALDRIPETTRQQHVAEMSEIDHLLQTAWTNNIVPFLYQLCVTHQFATSRYVYTDANGRTRAANINITHILQGINKTQLITQSSWMAINFEMAQTLMAWTLRDQLAGPQREHALALIVSTMLNTMLPCTADTCDNLPPKNVFDVLAEIVQMMATQEETQPHIHGFGHFIANSLTYLQTVGTLTATDLMPNFFEVLENIQISPAVRNKIIDVLCKNPIIKERYLAAIGVST